MKWFISHETLRSDFHKTIERTSHTKVSHCYQCGKCSAGCPISTEMEYLPNQIIRMVMLGMEKEALSSNTMWLCASCLTCTVRCPREIEIAEVMDALRRFAYRKGVVPEKEKHVFLFNRIFLKNIKKFGRLFEMNLIRNYNILSFNFFKDMRHAPKMFLKRKIGFRPHKVEKIDEVREIFKKTGEIEKTSNGGESL